MQHETPAVRIAATRPGLWRCGRQHNTTPAVHPPGTFSREEIERLVAEPLLVVDVDPQPVQPDEGPAGILEQALDAMRRASSGEIREFFRRMSEDRDIRARIDSEVDRQSRLTVAISGLEHGNSDHWTDTGKPRVDALEAATGLQDVTAAERDAAWEELEKARH